MLIPGDIRIESSYFLLRGVNDTAELDSPPRNRDLCENKGPRMVRIIKNERKKSCDTFPYQNNLTVSVYITTVSVFILLYNLNVFFFLSSLST